MRRRINPILFIFLILLLFNSFRQGEFADPMAWFLRVVLIIPGVVIGISFHEFAHGWTAYKLGDSTPKFQKRVTINPISHIDPIGFIALMLAGFGWGVPVEINPNNFRHRRRDEFLVSIAGVTMNLILAVLFTFIVKLIMVFFVNTGITQNLYLYLYYANTPNMSLGIWEIVCIILVNVIFINLILMFFNLIPVPPLDGFNIITEIFHVRRTPLYYMIYNNGFFILMGLIFFGLTKYILIPIFVILELLNTYIIGAV